MQFQIVNPLITAIIYAPYRMTLKRILISFPIGTRQPYNAHRIEYTETSFFSNSRHNNIQHQANLPRSRNQRNYVGEEMAEFASRPSAASSIVSSNKDSIGTFNGGMRGRRIQSEELGELINGQTRHDADSLIDEENESTSAISAQSQPTNSTQPKYVERVRTGSQRVSRSKFSTSESSEL